MTRRQRNVVKRMASGEVFFSKGSPRMTKREANELSELGFLVQVESAHGADRSAGLIFFRLHPKRFAERAREEGII